MRQDYTPYGTDMVYAKRDGDNIKVELGPDDDPDIQALLNKGQAMELAQAIARALTGK